VDANEGEGASAEVNDLSATVNEEEFVGALLERAIAAPLPAGWSGRSSSPDDGSTDSSIEEVEAVAVRIPGVIRLPPRASATKQRSGASGGRSSGASGEFAIVQDRDLDTTRKIIRHAGAHWRDGRADAAVRLPIHGSRRTAGAVNFLAAPWRTTCSRGMCNVFAT